MTSSSEHTLPPILAPVQWATLFSITSTIIHPTISPLPPATSTAATARLAAASASATNIPFTKALSETLPFLPPAKLTEIKYILDILASPLYTLSLLHSPYNFSSQPQETRQSLLLQWSAHPTSLVPSLRPTILFLIPLTIVTFLRACPDVWQAATDYTIPRPLSTTSWPSPPGRPGEEKGFYEFTFCKPEEVSGITWDAIIIGSGCGGGTVAKKLAEVGMNILVVDKGIWFSNDQFPLQDFRVMYEKEMNMRSADGSMGILAGNTWGGGSTVNWGASLQTQEYVRDEWAQKNGLTFFAEQGFQDCLDAVCERMGVNTEGIKHNHRNKMVLDGAKKLGWKAGVVPQNSSKEHRCGYCGYGCGGRLGARKMGGTQTWLPDAARAGAKFMTAFKVEKILFSDTSRSKATGITGTWSNSTTPITLNASRIIVSSGSLNSPVLLLRSGLSSKIPTIGHNLHLHPVTQVWGEMDSITDPMEGSPLTTIITEFENLDGEGHGFKIETPLMTLEGIGPAMPWRGSEEWKQDLAGFQKMSNLFPLQRDIVPGRVELDQDGGPKVVYTPSVKDREMMYLGVEACAKILYATGAVKIFAPVAGYPAFIRPSIPSLPSPNTDALFQTWLDGLRARCTPTSSWPSLILKVGTMGLLSEKRKPVLPLAGTQYITAHQMGSCRMSAKREDGGVVDKMGRVWGVQGLWIADASVLPSATGVNPMVSTMAIGEWIGRGIIEEWKKEIAK